MAVVRSHPVFAITFAVTYAILLRSGRRIQLGAVHVSSGGRRSFIFWSREQADGPSMYWYGWMATASLGALFIAAIVARQLLRRG